MATPHRVGDEAELRDRAPLPLKIERHRIAIFHHGGQFRAISDIRNHCRRLGARRVPDMAMARNGSTVS
jgi:hypothetical protein